MENKKTTKSKWVKPELIQEDISQTEGKALTFVSEFEATFAPS